MRNLGSAAVAATVVLGATAVPAAAQEVRYGGGAPLTSDSAPVAVSVSRDATTGQARFTVDTSVRCEGVATAFDVNVYGTAPVRGGAFRGETSTTFRSDDGRFAAVVQLEGAFAGAGAAGRVRVGGALRRRDGRTVECTPGSVARAWEARTFDTPAGDPAVPAAGTRFYGVATQVLRRDVLAGLQLTSVSGGTRMGGVFALRAQCETGPDLPFVNISPPALIAEDGRFRRDERFRVRYGDLTGVFDVALAGRVRRAADGSGTVDRIGGAVRVSLRFVDARGRTVDRCTSGAVTYSARA